MPPLYSLFVVTEKDLKNVNVAAVRKKIYSGVFYFILIVAIVSIIKVFFSGLFLIKEISELKKQHTKLTSEYENVKQEYNVLAQQYIEFPIIKRIISSVNPFISDETVTLWAKLISQHKNSILSSLNAQSLNKLAAIRQPYSLEPAVALLLSVAALESDFNIDATSAKGAYGPMQLHPVTINYIGLENPDSPADNIKAGILYFRQFLNRYYEYPDQLELALASYNAGSGRVNDSWIPQWGNKWQDINRGLVLSTKNFAETRSYVSTAVALARIFSSGTWNTTDRLFWSDYKRFARNTNTALSFKIISASGNYR